ncbi:MAG: hypothetical protein H0V13_06175 [Nocardioidaceae bacterium]|nr:hypothetical protein [Nocardioidaceae bacterium]
MLTVFTAFTAVPGEHLQSRSVPGLESLVRQRTAMARFILGLPDRTS